MGGKVASEEARREQAATSLLAQRNVERLVAEKTSDLSREAGGDIEVADRFGAAAQGGGGVRGPALPARGGANRDVRELQKQYLEAVAALLDTRREALETGEQLRVLTGMDFQACQTNKERKEQ